MSYNPKDFLSPKFLMGVLRERQDFGNERARYIGSRYLPFENVPEQTVVWETIRGENRLAGVYSAKGKAISGDEIGFSTYFANLLWIKAAKTLDPDVVHKIRAPGMIDVYKAGQSAFPIQGMKQRVENKFREYLTYIDDQMAAQTEYFATQAMQGQLVWPPVDDSGNPLPVQPEWNGDQKINITWPFVAKFKQNISTLAGVPLTSGGADRSGGGYAWNNDNADPLLDFEVITEMMLELKGVDADYATCLMSRRALSYIAMLPNIQRWVRGVNYEGDDPTGVADFPQFKQKIKTQFGLTIETYDAKWTYLDGVEADGKPIIKSRRFIPVNKMIIVPRGEKIGSMAQAPHESQDGNYVYGPDVYVKRDDIPPYEWEVGIQNICFPLLRDPEGIGVFDIFA